MVRAADECPGFLVLGVNRDKDAIAAVEAAHHRPGINFENKNIWRAKNKPAFKVVIKEVGGIRVCSRPGREPGPPGRRSRAGEGLVNFSDEDENPGREEDRKGRDPS